MFRKLKLSTKIFLLGIVIIVCFSVGMTFMFMKFKGDLLDDGRRDLKKWVEVASTVMAEYDGQVKKGEMSLEKAQKEALLRIKNRKNY